MRKSFTCKAASSSFRSTRWTSWQRDVTPSTGRTDGFFWKGLRTRLSGAKMSLRPTDALPGTVSSARHDSSFPTELGITYGHELTTSVSIGDAWYACNTSLIAVFCWCALTENLFVIARTQGMPTDLASSKSSARAGGGGDAFDWPYRGILWDKLCTRTTRSVFWLRSRIPFHNSSLKLEASRFRFCTRERRRSQ